METKASQLRQQIRLRAITGVRRPTLVLLILLGITIAIQVLASAAVSHFNFSAWWIDAAIRAGLLLVLLVPLLIRLVTRPLTTLLRAREQDRQKLRKARNRLEKTVKEQTDELRRANSELEAELKDKRKIEEKLQEVNQDLSNSVSRLEWQREKIALMSQMGSLLQSSRKDQEAFALIAEFGSRIFERRSGRLYRLANSGNYLEEMVSWGYQDESSKIYHPEDCWSLRRGKRHESRVENPSPICPHLTDLSPSETAYCIPLIGHGEAFGVLVLQFDTADKEEETSNQLLEIFAENLSLGLANLRLRDELEAQAIRDPLTNLYNRRYFTTALDREISRSKRKGLSLSLLMIDLDHFKKFNDEFGHDGGDTLLKGVGTLLNDSFRGEDIACRLGGEELGVLLPETTADSALKRAEETRQAIKHLRLRHQDGWLHCVTASIGVATFPEGHVESSEDLIQSADEALYAAKSEGRDRVSCFRSVKGPQQAATS